MADGNEYDFQDPELARAALDCLFYARSTKDTEVKSRMLRLADVLIDRFEPKKKEGAKLTTFLGRPQVSEGNSG